jgi:hypothetical protein
MVWTIAAEYNNALTAGTAGSVYRNAAKQWLSTDELILFKQFWG